MNSLRKIANWIWLNKERMVLAVMVVVLCVRVYRVIYPEAEGEKKNYQRAASNLGNFPPIPNPPPIPNDAAVPNPSGLYRNNPFNYVPPGKENKDDGQDIGLTLIRVQKSSAGVRAQIQSSSARKWLSEGDAFEEFELLSIDFEDECCWVYSEKSNSRVRICIEE